MSEIIHKYHPVLPDLKVSQDGQSIIWKGTPVRIDTYVKNGLPYKRVNVLGATHLVSRLVCAAWHGSAPSPTAVVQYLADRSNHYTNLMWVEKGTYTPLIDRKLSERDKQKAAKALKEGKTKVQVAKEFRVSINTVKRIKRNYVGTKPTPRSLSPRQELEVIEALKSGMSQRKVAEQFQVSTSTIKRTKQRIQ